MNEEDTLLLTADTPSGGEAAVQPAGSAGALPDGALGGTAEDELFAAEDAPGKETVTEPETTEKETPAPAAGPLPDPPQPSAPAAEPEQGSPQRDFRTEAAELLARYPNLRGSALPDAVVQDAVNNGTRLADAYAAYETNTLRTELETLRKENASLRAAADTAARAPVRGVSAGGETDTRPGDPFLAGFDAGY